MVAEIIINDLILSDKKTLTEIFRLNLKIFEYVVMYYYKSKTHKHKLSFLHFFFWTWTETGQLFPPAPSLLP